MIRIRAVDTLLSITATIVIHIMATQKRRPVTIHRITVILPNNTDMGILKVDRQHAGKDVTSSNQGTTNTIQRRDILQDNN